MYLIVKSYLVPRPHFSSRPKHFGSRGPCENARPFPARSPRIRHLNELTESDWENAVQGLGKLQRRYSEINEDCEDDWEGLRPRQSFVFAAISLNCKLGYVILQFGRAIGRTFFEANSRVLKVKNRPCKVIVEFLISGTYFTHILERKTTKEIRAIYTLNASLSSRLKQNNDIL